MQGNIFARLFERVVSVPHRNVTSVPYGEWFGLYVQALKGAQKNAVISGDKEELRVARRALDVAFLSSVFSQKWTDVMLPNGSSSTTTTRWCQESTEAEWLLSSGTIHRRELLTTSFLVEPLLSGRAIASWTAAVRRGDAFSATAAADGEAPAPTGMIVIPFTALFQLRWEAYLCHQTFSVGGEGKKTPQHSFSLQERGARLTALQSLRHLLELQSDSKRKSRVQFVVWSPVNEFDAIMRVSQVRAGLPDALKGIFSLTHVCEQEVVRAAYLAHYLNFATQRAPLTVLTSQMQYAKLHLLGLTNCCAKSELKFGEEGEQHRSCGNPNGVSLHQQAVNRCGRLARRMSTREENLRNILIP
ncbi:hypothetical protein MOQ_008637 [Trypanosoma cruzi marinkellei]|uniref:Uncharacterized protein n=1 Tax=Trypanosoma cruzi marinkellei TaxID=85056 RepID=K2NF86_TRYCR|nr:hypothetical protein MOQ_008637 [Trypanosoma cruzi marinkellei]